MRVVLDTNVIIAAFAARGLCAEIFEVCLAEDTIIISEHILSEVKENLVKKIHLQKDIVQNIIEYLRDTTELFKPQELDKSTCRDKDDGCVRFFPGDGFRHGIVDRNRAGELILIISIIHCTAFSGRDAGYNDRSVFDHLFSMKRALGSGDALHNEAGVLIDKYAHRSDKVE